MFISKAIYNRDEIQLRNTGLAQGHNNRGSLVLLGFELVSLSRPDYLPINDPKDLTTETPEPNIYVSCSMETGRQVTALNGFTLWWKIINIFLKVSVVLNALTKLVLFSI